ncbi:MAG: hypothetical protein AB8I69_00375 [Anaerolineae bacterium]|jgi:hypothetical protein
MKTGRRRQKQVTEEKAPEEGKSPAPQPKPTTRPSKPASRSPLPRWLIPTLAVAIVLCVLVIGIFMCGRSCFAPKAESYLPATAEGSWQTTVKVLAPQMVRSEGWRSDCESDPDCTVLSGTCQMRPREDKFTETQVDEYDDFAYSIYYEEEEAKIYEASGTDFAVTELNPPKDWVEDDRHYYAEEWLDKETCQYTNYTVWITDPGDATEEIEVVLSECEVWEHVVVKERIYENEEYCQTEIVDTLTVKDTLSENGTGADVSWPQAQVPADGELEHDFRGTIIFRADGVEHTVHTDDENAYVRYVTVPHYLGLNKNGKVVSVTDKAP